MKSHILKVKWTNFLVAEISDTCGAHVKKKTIFEVEEHLVDFLFLKILRIFFPQNSEE